MGKKATTILPLNGGKIPNPGEVTGRIQKLQVGDGLRLSNNEMSVDDSIPRMSDIPIVQTGNEQITVTYSPKTDEDNPKYTVEGNMTDGQGIFFTEEDNKVVVNAEVTADDINAIPSYTFTQNEGADNTEVIIDRHSTAGVEQVVNVKVPKLIAGTPNVTISGTGIISVDESGSEYTAGSGIEITEDNVINNTAQGIQYDAGDGISIENNVISNTAKGIEYQAGENISIDSNNVISAVDTDTTYTAGDGISISTDNVISADKTTMDIPPIDYYETEQTRLGGGTVKSGGNGLCIVKSPNGQSPQLYVPLVGTEDAETLIWNGCGVMKNGAGLRTDGTGYVHVKDAEIWGNDLGGVKLSDDFSLDDSGFLHIKSGGGGGSTVEISGVRPDGDSVATIKVDGVSYNLKSKPADVQQTITSGTEIGSIDGTKLYAPNGTEGSTVEVVVKETTGRNIADIKVDDETYSLYAPEGSTGSIVSFEQKLSSGTNIGAITIDGTTTQLYAPQGGGGGGLEYAKVDPSSNLPNITVSNIILNRALSSYDGGSYEIIKADNWDDNPSIAYVNHNGQWDGFKIKLCSGITTIKIVSHQNLDLFYYDSNTPIASGLYPCLVGSGIWIGNYNKRNDEFGFKVFTQASGISPIFDGDKYDFIGNNYLDTFKVNLYNNNMSSVVGACCLVGLTQSVSDASLSTIISIYANHAGSIEVKPLMHALKLL